MAEAIVNFVLDKLGDAALQEALLLYGIDEQVETVGRELGWIQAFLKEADKKQIRDERQKHWVKEVRDVAYSIEDVIDTFLAEIPHKPQKYSGVKETMKTMIMKTRKLPIKHKLMDEIREIHARLKEIELNRVRYGIDKLGNDTGVIELPTRPVVIPDINPEVVGFEADLQHVVKELLDKTNKRSSVVSIWGPGGIGKTTLAQKAYNTTHVKGQFNLRIWLTISQKFELLDILRKIGQDLKLSVEQLEKEDEFIISIHKFLRGKKYFIVLDDVWSKDLWIKIRATFANENNGSRVLLTTRSFDVAKNADPMCDPYQLGFLTKELGLQLLLKKTLPNKSAFDDLSEIVDKFVEKCGGLPLALVVLGGLLVKKPHNYTTWSNVLQTMNWHVDGKMCTEILDSSFEELPLVLKSCFMYLAAFPEDYEISATPLIRMWVAEGFIPQENNRTLEETAVSYLEDLVQRSMVQVRSRDFDGSIKECHVHDLMRDLAIQKAEEDNFLMVYSCPNDQPRVSKARRVAIHHQSDCHKLIMSPNFRTLLCFDVEYMPNCSKLRLLKVISNDVKDWSLNGIQEDMKSFEGLIQLRFLKLSGRRLINIKCQEEYLPKVIGHMMNLQTLHIPSLVDSNKKSIELPDCTWNINTLRHVITSHFTLPSSAKLTNLQSLESVSIEGSEEELPQVPNIKILDLHYTCAEPPSWGPLVAFLSTLEYLTSFKLRLHNCYGTPIPLEILDMRRLPFYQHLQYLTLYGHVSGIRHYHVDMFPPHITSLSISHYDDHQDIMLILERLPSQKNLSFMFASNIKKMRCSAGGFTELEYLVFYSKLERLEEWEIEECGMPILKSLSIKKLSVLPRGLQYLVNLQELMVNKKHEDAVLNLCKHVPLVTFHQ